MHRIIQSFSTADPLEIPDFRALQHIPVNLKRLCRRGNSPLAKVGVEGSNPFARSNLINDLGRWLDGQSGGWLPQS
jgi:hypothetical protein